MLKFLSLTVVVLKIEMFLIIVMKLVYKILAKLFNKPRTEDVACSVMKICLFIQLAFHSCELQQCFKRLNYANCDIYHIPN